MLPTMKEPDSGGVRYVIEGFKKRVLTVQLKERRLLMGNLIQLVIQSVYQSTKQQPKPVANYVVFKKNLTLTSTYRSK